MISNTLSLTLLSSLLLFSGCGSEVNDLSEHSQPITTEPETGHFIDSGVEGLSYVRSSIGTSLVTQKGGSYVYRTGEIITFKIGELKIGEAIGLSVITPKDIVSLENKDLSTSIYESEVNNRVRLLMTLDSDSNPTNGIQISAATRAQAASWSTPHYEYSETGFNSSVAVVTNGDVDINITKLAAEEHFAESLRCVYSGAYTGYRVLPDGEHDGFVGVMIQSTNTKDVNSSFGTIVALSDGQELDGNTSTNEYLFARGIHDMDTGTYIFNETGEFKDGGIIPSAANVTGDGTSNGYNKVFGTFKQLNPQTGLFETGAYEATRAFEGKNVAYRYTGYGYDTNISVQNPKGKILGLFAFDINTDGTIEGMIHDAATGEEPLLSGTINFTTNYVDMNLTYNNTPSVIQGTLDNNGSINLEWKVNGVTAGSLGGVGCQLQPHD